MVKISWRLGNFTAYIGCYLRIVDDVPVLEVYLRPAELLPAFPFDVPHQCFQLLPLLPDSLLPQRRQLQLLGLLGNLQHLH